MKEIFENTSYEILKEYFYDLRGCYPPENFSRDVLIKILLNNK